MQMKIITQKAAALLLVLSMGASLAGCQTPAEDPEIWDEAETETLAPVRVNMPDYTFEYSGELAEAITLEENKKTGELAFFVTLSTEKAPLFTLRINSDEGDFVTVIRDASNNPVPVAFRMETIPEGLEEADQELFYIAQDEVNAIAASIVLK